MSRPQPAVVVVVEAVEMWAGGTAVHISTASGAESVLRRPSLKEAWGEGDWDGAGRITLGLRGRGLAWSLRPFAPTRARTVAWAREPESARLGACGSLEA
jgi:hypothetical protein